MADGKQIWFYDKDLAQANVRDMDTSLASTPASLLSGSASVSTQFNVTALPPSGGLQWFQLMPKHADTDFQLVRIGFDKRRIASMFLADKLNQITQLTFSNSKRNDNLAPDLFTFVPPPGVDVQSDSASEVTVAATARTGRWPTGCARSLSMSTWGNRICWAPARRCAARWSPAARIR